MAIFGRLFCQFLEIFGNFLQILLNIVNLLQVLTNVGSYYHVSCVLLYRYLAILSVCMIVNLSSCHLVSLAALQFVWFSICQPVDLSACKLVSLSACASWSLRACLYTYSIDKNVLYFLLTFQHCSTLFSLSRRNRPSPFDKRPPTRQKDHENCIYLMFPKSSFFIYLKFLWFIHQNWNAVDNLNQWDS